MIELDGTKGFQLRNDRDYSDEVIEKDLNFKLTEDDFSTKGKEAGKLAGELRELEIEFDGVKKAWKEKLGTKEGELASVLGTIRRGDEDRRVKCVERKDYNNHEVLYIFQGQVMHKREMKMEERQMTMVKNHTEGVEAPKSFREQLNEVTPQAPVDSKTKDIREVMREETNKKTATDMSN